MNVSQGTGQTPRPSHVRVNVAQVWSVEIKTLYSTGRNLRSRQNVGADTVSRVWGDRRYVGLLGVSFSRWTLLEASLRGSWFVQSSGQGVCCEDLPHTSRGQDNSYLAYPPILVPSSDSTLASSRASVRFQDGISEKCEFKFGTDQGLRLDSVTWFLRQDPHHDSRFTNRIHTM